MTIRPVLLFLFGLLCLIKGGDWFVDGAANLARRFHLPEILVGATVVSIGTTLPEVMVSAAAAMQGHGEIAYGNAIGSVICNTALIAALTAAIRPEKTASASLRTPVLFFFLAAALYAGIAYTGGYFSRWIGIILLSMFLIYMLFTITEMRQKPDKPNAKKQDSSEQPDSSLGQDLLFLALGVPLIALGAQLLVDNGTLIAQAMGVPESVIALTFVSLGTSLPELVTAVTSLLKGYSSLSLGNIIGANLFNLVLVSGVAMTLSPFSIPQSATLFGQNASLVLDIPVMFLVMIILTIPTLFKEKLSRWQGISLLTIYAVFCMIQFIMP